MPNAKPQVLPTIRVDQEVVGASEIIELGKRGRLNDVNVTVVVPKLGSRRAPFGQFVLKHKRSVFRTVHPKKR